MRLLNYDRYRVSGEESVVLFDDANRATDPYYTISGVYREMYDVHRSSASIHNPHDVLHTTVDASRVRVRSPLRYLDGGVHELMNVGPPFGRLDVEAVCPLCPSSLWLDANSEAFDNFTTAFPEEVSVGNFVWELRELGDMIPQLAVSLHKAIAGGFLTKEFAVEPFISDLKKLGLLVVRTNERIAYLRKRWGIPTRLGLRKVLERELPEPLVVEPPLVAYSKVNRSPQGGWNAYDYVRLRWSYRPTGMVSVFTAGGYLIHQLYDMDSFLGKTRAFLYTTGLGNPAKVVWTALPFSFIVDWLFDISGLLTRMAKPHDPWEVYGTSSSILTEATVAVSQQLLDPLYHNVDETPVDIGEIRIRRYERRSGLELPDSFKEQALSDPRKLVLSLAMLAGASK